MPARAFPGIGLQGGFSLNESGWDDEMNANLLNSSALINLRVISRIAAVPVSPTDGDMYILTAAPNQHAIAVRDNGAWVYITPKVGYRAFDDNTDKFVYFNGTAWVDEVSLTGSTPGMVLLAAAQISNNSQIDLTTGFDQGFDNYLVRGVGIIAPSGGGGQMYMRVQNNGSWVTAANTYRQGLMVENVNSGGTGSSAKAFWTASSFQFGYGMPGAAEPNMFNCYVEGVAGRAAGITCYRKTHVTDYLNGLSHQIIGGQTVSSLTNLSGLRFFTLNGGGVAQNFVEGSIYLYGLRKTV